MMRALPPTPSRRPAGSLPLAALAFTLSLVPATFADSHEAKGLDVLRRADAALRTARGLRYDFEYLGTGANRSRITGTATLVRLAVDRSAYRAEIAFALPPPGFAAHPRAFALASDGEAVWRRDDESRRLEHASLASMGSYLTRAIGFALLPQWHREAPLGIEMEGSETVRYAGRTRLDGVDCDVVFVGFDADTGLGDQFFTIGRADGLPRRVTMVAPAAGADLPTWHFELRLSDVRIVDTQASDMTLIAPAGHQTIEVDRRRIEAGAPAPTWELATPSGTSVSLTDLHGRVVLLDFWASWCPICTDLLPTTEAIHNDYAAADVAVYAVHIWDAAPPQPVLRARGVDLPILIEGDAVADLYKVGATPTTLIIGRDGRIVHREVGGDAARADRLRAMIERALAAGDG